jgi:subtilisin
MRDLRWIAVVLALVFCLPGVAPAQPSGAGRADVIVLFDDAVPASQREDLLRAAGAVTTRRFNHVPAAAASLDAHGRAFLEQHPAVKAVIPDRPVEKLGKPTGGGGGSQQQSTPSGVARVRNSTVTYTGSGVGVAIVDTGIDFNHADLAVGATCFTAYTACQDDDGHGTHVSGIVAAKDNAIDVVGVAPAATVYAVKVLNQNGSGTDSTIMAGLDWVRTNANAVAPPIRVVNMSLGRTGSVDDNPALHASVQALTTVGIVVVVAAGNDATLTVAQQIPAAYAEVMAIASTTAVGGASACTRHPASIAADSASYFTTDGAGVAVSAPGEDHEDISKSCFISSAGILSTRLGGGTTTMSGTSMAAPHVTGVVALLEQAFPGLTPASARSRIANGASRIGVAPLDSASSIYTYDGMREGVVSASGALSAP